MEAPYLMKHFIHTSLFDISVRWGWCRGLSTNVNWGFLYGEIPEYRRSIVLPISREQSITCFISDWPTQIDGVCHPSKYHAFSKKKIYKHSHVIQLEMLFAAEQKTRFKLVCSASTASCSRSFHAIRWLIHNGWFLNSAEMFEKSIININSDSQRWILFKRAFRQNHRKITQCHQIGSTNLHTEAICLFRNGVSFTICISKTIQNRTSSE
jgi:hypothetical protein